MRMNKVTLTGLLSLFFLSNSYAQESFLKLDSLQIIETTHALPKISNSNRIGCYDTLVINVGIGQVAKLINSTLSIRSNSLNQLTSIASSDITFSGSYELVDVRLDLNKTNVINSNHFGKVFSTNPIWAQGTNNFGVTIDQSYFLTTGSHHVIVKYAGRKDGSNSDRDLISRLELVYYSYE